MLNTAVILAAGLGSRLGNKLMDKPKGFIEFDEESIILRSIKNLKNAGITKIIIGTGHLSFHYEKFEDDLSIFCKKNNFYKNTDSFFTLYNLKDHIQEDFLLLESDILYEKRAIDILINHKKKDVILASGKTESNDEVFLEVHKNNCLLNLSKTKNNLSEIYGELVGVSKISFITYQILCVWAKNNKYEAKHLHYEEALVRIINEKDIYVEKLDDLIWIEIDTVDHYERARKYIYPELLKKENE